LEQQLKPQLLDYCKDRPAFYREMLRIADEDKKIGPLILAETQEMIFHVKQQIRHVHRQQLRLMILKGRQTYTTTETAADLFTELWFAPGPCRVACITDLSDHTNNVRRMLEIFVKECPINRPMSINHSDGTVTFQDTGAFFESMTAKTGTSGRSSTIIGQHLSECAFFPANGSADMVTGLLHGFPDRVGTSVIFETTANGYDTVFFPRWSRSLDRARAKAHEFGAKDQYDLLFNLSGWGDKPDKDGELHPNGWWDGSYFPLFVEWTRMEKYRRDPAKEGLTLENLTEMEKAIMKTYNLDLWQLAFRRYDIREKCGGDTEYSDDDPKIAIFQQEMPLSPEEAFTTSSRSVFHQRIVNIHLARTKTLARMVYEKNRKRHRVIQPASLQWKVAPRFDPDGGYCINKDKLRAVAYHDSRADLRIFRLPNSEGYENRYVISFDSAMGNVTSHYSAAAVIDATTGLRVAQYRGKIPPHDFGVFLARLAIYYDRAWILGEINYPGNAVHDTLLRYYDRVLERERPADKFAGEVVKQYGFHTGDDSKHTIIDKLDRAMKQTPHNFPFEWFWSEALTFVHYNGRKMGAEGKQNNDESGTFDDVIMCNAIGEVAMEWAPKPHKPEKVAQPQWYVDMYGEVDEGVSVIDDIPYGVNKGKVL